MTRTVYDIIDRCAADMITVHAVGGDVLWVSGSAEAVFRWKPEKLVGMSMPTLAHVDDRERVAAHYEGGERSGGSIRYRLRQGDGTYRTVETRTRVDEQDGSARLVSITRDVYQEPTTATSSSGEHAVNLPIESRGGDQRPQRPTVLVVDDEAEMRELLSAMLGRKYRVLTARDGRQALRVIEQDTVTAVVSDVCMDGMDGDELLRVVRDDSKTAHIPVLLVTARTESEFRTRALRDGATDYVTKPFDRDELMARIDNLVHSSQAFRELSLQTRIDSLTKVFTRGRVLNIVEQQNELSLTSDYPLSVVMVDIDYFKSVNDTHGHSVGDEVLREVARRLRDNVRNGDAVGRYGGEEFLIVLPSCDYASALELAEELRQAVGAVPVGTSAGPVHVTISGGVCTSPGGRLSHAELIQAADRALYRAKRGGRDRIAA